MCRLSNFFCFVLLFLIVGNSNTFAQSQGRIEGKATDENGEPVIGAIIFAQSSEGIARGKGVTDIDGYYMIVPLVPGTYDVKATYEYYKKVSITKINVSPDRITKVNVPFNANSLSDTVMVWVYEAPSIITRTPICKGEGFRSVPTRDMTKLVATPTPTEKNKKVFFSFPKRKKKSNE